MSYDPDDDFDNNPFAQPQHDVLNGDGFKSDESQYHSPYNNIYSNNPIVNGFGSDIATNNVDAVGGSGGLITADKENQELPKIPDQENTTTAQSSEEQGKPNFEPDLTLLPERRSKKNYHITIKVVGIERVAKKDPIIKFNALTNLPNFRGTTFKDIRRSYGELEKFFQYLNGANPECFVPSLPAAQTSYGAGSEEDEEALERQVQDWFNRVTDNPILIRNEEFVFFIENDFGYSPINKGKVPATGLKRKTLKQFQPPYDEVTELVEFRPYIKSVYLITQEIIKTFDKTTRLRKNYGLHVAELGHKITELSKMETLHPGMVNLWQKFGKSMIVYGDIEAVKSVYESALFGDEITRISSDSYIIKEQLTNRHLLMRELINAEQITKSKHAQALKVKTKRYEDPIKIDQIIRELEESKKVEDVLRAKVDRVSSNMLIEKQQVVKHQDQQFKSILRNYTRKIIDHERKLLSNFEKIRLDVRSVDENGGLSRLGRENYPKMASNVRNSQRFDGDDWSGDRKHKRNHSSISKDDATKEVTGKVGVAVSKKSIEQVEETFDARSAATLLGTSAF
ncbi:retromer subunit [Saccharomycopsis crataegensis]|uniref:Vacuolar protein sorting-associated protein 17 n=1 Tax=Saccharomycopsis crataegensis TaxID=43959 RepID=A0AAV5QQB2_9ASCO|nr:retromer subunit [Saccharomycopsis crataegensis]